MGGGISALFTLIFLLSPVNLLAQSDVKVVFNSADKSLTFQKGGTVPEGAEVYALNEGDTKPGWSAQRAKITKVVFDPSFADVRPTSCYRWFWGCSKLTDVQGLEYLNTSQVTNMSFMFSTCSKLTSLDLRYFDTSQVTTMEYMFSTCFKLANLNVLKFNTSKVENMECMFKQCEALTTLDLSKFDTSKVTNMSSMFVYCSLLTSLNISNFNTSKVEKMDHMFFQCKVLPSIDLSHFDTSKVTTFHYMFSQCYALTELDLSSFDTSNVTDVNNFGGMFNLCENIETIYVSDKFIMPNGNMIYPMFLSCEKLVGAVAYKDLQDETSKMANSKTGYFKAYKNYGTHKVEKVELYGNKAHYQRNHTYEWATICLPFAFSTNDNAAYRFYALKGVEGNSLSTTMLSGTIAAGTPVFVRGANTAGNKIEIVGVDDVLVNEAQTQTTTTANLVGTFADKTNLSNDNYIILKDNFWLASDLINNRPGSSVNINALRAYITPAVAGAMGANVLTITVDDEGGVTGINGVEAAENEGTEMYDLQGRRLKSLQRGLNIVRVGGKTKKVMVY